MNSDEELRVDDWVSMDFYASTIYNRHTLGWNEVGAESTYISCGISATDVMGGASSSARV